jgi:dTDP-4-amino-4,6-dideoxygalactose transaminase
MAGATSQKLRTAPVIAFPGHGRLPVAQPLLPSAEAILPYLQRIDQQRWYSNFGPLVTSLEQRLADRFAPPAGVVTVSSGTQGLILALKALGARRGSLCALPSWTFVATAHAVLQAGLIPWFLDVDPDTWMLDPDHVRSRLWAAPGAVAAVITVAAFGRTPDFDRWCDFRRETGVPVLVDAAAAFDALDDARIPAVVSMHATKAFGVGEGGFVAAADNDYLARVRELSSFGFRGSREAHVPATNAKLSEYAAAVGLAGLDCWSATRGRFLMAAQSLRVALIEAPEVEFQPGWGTTWMSSVCVVRVPEAKLEAVEANLTREGVDTRRWWANGCHAGPVFAGCPRDSLPHTLTLARSTLGLPFAADLDHVAVNRIAGAVLRGLGQG